MTAGYAERELGEIDVTPPARAGWLRRFSGLHIHWPHVFTSLTRRIVVLNLAALLVLVVGILYLNQFRAGLIDARVSSLLTQGEIIAGAIASEATVDEANNLISIDPERLLALQAGESVSPLDEPYEAVEFSLNPEQVAPLLNGLVTPTRTTARVYDRDGTPVLDSRAPGKIQRFDLPSLNQSEDSWFGSAWRLFNVWLSSRDLPVYKELAGANGRGYEEVVAALNGNATHVVRVNEQGELIVSVAVPIHRYRSVDGVLLLSTQGGDIDAIVDAERLAILRVFLVAAGVTVLLSILLASTIAAPLRRLAEAATRVRHRATARQQIPDFSNRRDEIGHLSRALREMTMSLYDRIDAIESFAADVAHEIKNPLTSLRSAVETLPLAKNPQDNARLTAIIQHDIRRLDRLISDISDASRLDAELSRQDSGTLDLRRLLTAVVGIASETAGPDGAEVKLEFANNDRGAYMVCGHDSRLGQVFNNLVDNALSFCRKDGCVRVIARPTDEYVEVVVEDDGPGIRADQFERVFERFYTDRDDSESFGQNSGLGLSISKQIVEAHNGSIWVENRTQPNSDPAKPPTVLGARFTVRLPTA